MKDLLTFVALFATVLFLSPSCTPEKEIQSPFLVYVSSGDGEDGVGIGIYGWTPEEGKLMEMALDSAISNSSYHAVDTNKSILYSVNGEGIHAFKINTKDGSLKFINRTSLTGKGPCYVSVSNNQRFLMVAYYSSGGASTYALNEDGSVGKMVSNVQHEGSSINVERQTAAHAHMIYPAPKSNLVLVPDLGIDKVMVYASGEEGGLTPAPEPLANIWPGGGPRHLAFHPNNQFVFVLHELTSRVTGFNFDPVNGIMDSINTVNILPDEFVGFSKAADIHLTPDGQYLYASNRGHNSLAVCRVDSKTGGITLLGTQSCGGDWPRAFAIDPSGRFILAANKNDDQISVLKIDYETGFFEKVDEIKTPKSPQGIRFVKR